MYGRALLHLLFWSGLGFGLTTIAKPSETEVQKIKDFTAKNSAFSEVLRAAADPNSKPIYLQKPGEQFRPKNNLQPSQDK